ncbi:MAG: hypothetical protein ACRET1_04295, partial [Burkholderiales bacterium]
MTAQAPAGTPRTAKTKAITAEAQRKNNNRKDAKAQEKPQRTSGFVFLCASFAASAPLRLKSFCYLPGVSGTWTVNP